MDGVLVDNARFHTRAWLQLFEQLGIPVDPQAFHLRNAGQTNAAILRMMLGDNLSDGQVRAYASRKESIYRELYRPHLQPLPGLRAFLEKSQKLGVPMALATSADEQNVALVLDGLDLRRYFSVIVAARDIQHSKPHPQVFLLAADRLGLAPADCVVFEDSQAGAESARRAGMRLVLITTSLDGQALAEICGVEIAVKDFTRLDPRCLLTP